MDVKVGHNWKKWPSRTLRTPETSTTRPTARCSTHSTVYQSSLSDSMKWASISRLTIIWEMKNIYINPSLISLSSPTHWHKTKSRIWLAHGLIIASLDFMFVQEIQPSLERPKSTIGIGRSTKAFKKLFLCIINALKTRLSNGMFRLLISDSLGLFLRTPIASRNGLRKPTKTIRSLTNLWLSILDTITKPMQKAFATLLLSSTCSQSATTESWGTSRPTATCPLLFQRRITSGWDNRSNLMFSSLLLT